MPVSTAVSDVRRIAHGPMRRLFIGQFLNALGNGLTLALLIVYLTQVRGISVTMATSLLAWQAILALLISPVMGTLVDRRFGPRPVLLASVLVEATGVFYYGQVTSTAQAFIATTIVAIGGAGIWGPASALTARLVPSQDRPTAFGFGFMLLNLGLGLGGLISATIVDVDDPATFTLLYTLTSVTYLALFGAVLSMGKVGGLPPAEPDPTTVPVSAELSSTDPGPTAETQHVVGEGEEAGSWLDVLRDRTLLRYALAGLLMLTFGYGSIDAGVSLYILNSVGLSEHYIGVVFASNTAVIVIAQLFILGVIKGRSRARTMAAVGVIWSGSWLLFAASLGMPVDAAKVVVLIAAMAAFAIGETLWSPVAPALLNDLAPEHLRGRYNAFQSVLWGVSGALGPVITGLFLSAEHGLTWTLTLALGCAVAALMALRLRNHLTPAQDGVADLELEPAAS